MSQAFKCDWCGNLFEWLAIPTHSREGVERNYVTSLDVRVVGLNEIPDVCNECLIEAVGDILSKLKGQ
jgi:hypothetical protein